MQLSRPLLIIALTVGCSAALPCVGQSQMPNTQIGIRLPHTIPRADARSIGIGVEPATPKQSAVPFVLGGAIVGVLVAAVAVAISFRLSDQEFIGSPVAFVPLFVGSGVVGAGAGYLLYHAKR
jgi:hypothetical protein